MKGNSVTKPTRGTERKSKSPAIEDEAVRRDIALVAYYRYRERGSIPGFALEDWLAAEQDVLARHAQAGAHPAGPSEFRTRAGRRGKRTSDRQ
jgi:hypothetical protein